MQQFEQVHLSKLFIGENVLELNPSTMEKIVQHWLDGMLGIGAVKVKSVTYNTKSIGMTCFQVLIGERLECRP